MMFWTVLQMNVSFNEYFGWCFRLTSDPFLGKITVANRR